MFRLTQQHRDQLIPHLASWNLVFLVNDDESATAWETLDAQIHQHLKNNNIDIAPISPLHDEPYQNLSWTLCPMANSRAGVANYQPLMPPKYDFTFAHLRSVARPDPLDQGYDVFFVCQLVSLVVYYTSLT
jgi:hypothetical protein